MDARVRGRAANVAVHAALAVLAARKSLRLAARSGRNVRPHAGGGVSVSGAYGSAPAAAHALRRLPRQAMPKPSGSELMERIVALAKRRGFVFPASEIYGGINGFWDYGPLGVQLKNNLRDAWWHEMVECPPLGPDGQPLTSSGSTRRSSRTRGRGRRAATSPASATRWSTAARPSGATAPITSSCSSRARAGRRRPSRSSRASTSPRSRRRARSCAARSRSTTSRRCPTPSSARRSAARVYAPGATRPGTLTEPRQFNLMFRTYVGATSGDDNVAYLRPETAQGIFLNFKNVVDTSRVSMPFGIAQIGKAFRNEVTPRNFIFRSREFEQMEMEWFCAPEEAGQWYEFWTKTARRVVAIARRQVRQPEAARARDRRARALRQGGVGTCDIEYRFPFTAPGFGELEGIAHRSTSTSSSTRSSARRELEYFDPETRERYLPHVIEPAAGLTRGVLVLLCEAYTSTRAGPARDPALPPAARADQGGDLPAGRQGRHAGDRGEALPRPAPPPRRAVRRQAVDRQALRAHGRGGHAVLLHHRRRDGQGPDGHGARSRHRRPGAHRARSRAAVPSRSIG